VLICTPAYAQVQVNPLTELIKQALTSYPSVHSQEFMVSVAKAEVDGARWQYFPTPAISIQQVGANSNDVSYQGDSRVSTLSLSQPLWTWGRLSAGMDKAQAQELVAVASYEETKLQLALRVLQSYGEWFSAYRKRVAYEKGLELHERLKAQANRRMEAGQAAPVDLAFAQGRLATMQAEMTASQTQEQISLARLSQLVGHTLDSNALTTSLPQAIALTTLPAQLLSQADASSPTLARYRGQAQLQLAAMKEQKASILPEVSLKLERQYGNFNYLGSETQTRAFVGLNSNFGAGLSKQAALVEAANRYDSALADIETQQRTLIEIILTDYTLLLRADARRQALQQAADLTDQVLASSDRQYLSGRKTWQDLMNIAREQVQAQLQLADMDASQLVATWRITLLTEGLANTLGQAKALP
jgi:adhesin transport system outer membrane protein